MEFSRALLALQRHREEVDASDDPDVVVDERDDRVDVVAKQLRGVGLLVGVEEPSSAGERPIGRMDHQLEELQGHLDSDLPRVRADHDHSGDDGIEEQRQRERLR